MQKKIIGGILIAIAVLVAGGLLVFKLFVAQGVSPTYEINQPQKDYQSVLIATQKKGFKDTVMQQISNYYQDKPIYIKVIDVTKLNEVEQEDWDKIILFTTVEMGKVPGAVTNFLEKQSDLSNVFLPVTAASGIWNGNQFDVDAIATASLAENTETTANSIIEFIDTNK